MRKISSFFSLNAPQSETASSMTPFARPVVRSSPWTCALTMWGWMWRRAVGTPARTPDTWLGGAFGLPRVTRSAGRVKCAFHWRRACFGYSLQGVKTVSSWKCKEIFDIVFLLCRSPGRHFVQRWSIFWSSTQYKNTSTFLFCICQKIRCFLPSAVETRLIISNKQEI